MEIRHGKNGILEIDDARIIWRNFAGIGGKYNREGDRNFAVIFDDEEVVNQLKDEGWNIRVKPPRDDQDTPFMYLPVKVKFSNNGPRIYVTAGSKTNLYTEDIVKNLDNIEIESVSMDIRPYNYNVNGNTGVSAYLQNMRIWQVVDRFAEDMDEEDESDPF